MRKLLAWTLPLELSLTPRKTETCGNRTCYKAIRWGLSSNWDTASSHIHETMGKVKVREESHPPVHIFQGSPCPHCSSGKWNIIPGGVRN